mgnify:CR=1 FL=1
MRDPRGEKRCLQCSRRFTPASRGKRGEQAMCCSRRCALLHQYRSGSRTRLGWQKPGLGPTINPTIHDIVFAAGIYEGEGWCQKARGSGGGTTQMVAVGQNGVWLVRWLRERFGGSIYRATRTVGHQNYKTRSWHIHGARARGFMMTIYQFLSPRRKAQIRKVLAA